MRISVVMVYLDRPRQLERTLRSYAEFRPTSPIELLIVEEYKNARDATMHDALMDVVARAEGVAPVVIKDPFEGTYNATKQQNMAIRMASGDVVVLTCPEVFHHRNIFKDIETRFEGMPRQYVSYACWSDGERGGWLQHSARNSRALYYCAAATKTTWAEIGPIDERYCHGLGWEDNDLIRTLLKLSVPIVQVDDPWCEHQAHSRTYDLTPEQVQEKIHLAKGLFKEKWGDDQVLYLNGEQH